MARLGFAAWALTAVLGAAPMATAMELSSPDIAEGRSLATAQLYTECGGGNVSPALSWSGAPGATKSFALTLYDGDASGGWWHWIVYDIPPGVNALTRGSVPAGALMGENDFDSNAYGGACPPPGSGAHHYRFTLWALDVADTPFKSGVTGKTVEAFLTAHALARATITALYER